MPGEQFWLALAYLWEFRLEGLGDLGMQGAAWFAQQRAVGGVLHQGMLEQIARMWRHALLEQQASLHQPI